MVARECFLYGAKARSENERAFVNLSFISVLLVCIDVLDGTFTAIGYLINEVNCQVQVQDKINGFVIDL